MREIKFRAWDKTEKKMIFHENTCGGLRDFFDKMHLINDGYGRMNLMQHTGLLDKNGKEIYEGDIVKWLNQMQSKEDYAKNPYKQKVVKWGKESCSFNISTIDNDYEVIGNIYENPELVNAQP